MNFKLSKYIILSDIFKEENDDKKAYRILFSCRKKMGIKVHIVLVDMLKKAMFDKLPDNTFSLLMHYEIIIPEEENEELYNIKMRKALYYQECTDYNTPYFTEKQQKGSLYEFLEKENSKLKQLIDDGVSYDFLSEDYKASFLFVNENRVESIAIDTPETYRNYNFNVKKIKNLSQEKSFLLPVEKYEVLGKIENKDLVKIIENFKLMLLLKYKINTKYD